LNEIDWMVTHLTQILFSESRNEIPTDQNVELYLFGSYVAID